MKIRICVDEKFPETEIVICTDKNTQRVRSLKEDIGKLTEGTLTGYSAKGVRKFALHEIIRIYSERDKVLAQCTSGIFQIKETLTELEARFGERPFVRISRSQIMNMDKIRRLDTSLTGTIWVYLDGYAVTYVSNKKQEDTRYMKGAEGC